MTNAGIRIGVLLLLGILGGHALAQALDSGVRVDGAWARRAPMLASPGSAGGTGNGAVYGVLANSGSQADALVSAATDAASVVEIHESYQEAGMMKMRQIAKIDVPAGKSVEMKPGGYHIMLLNLRRDLEAGHVVDLTLRFEKAGTVAVKAQIR